MGIIPIIILNYKFGKKKNISRVLCGMKNIQELWFFNCVKVALILKLGQSIMVNMVSSF